MMSGFPMTIRRSFVPCKSISTSNGRIAPFITHDEHCDWRSADSHATSRLIPVANPERRLSSASAPSRDLLWAAWDGCLGDENVSGKFEPSAQFPHLFQGEISLSSHEHRNGAF